MSTLRFTKALATIAGCAVAMVLVGGPVNAESDPDITPEEAAAQVLEQAQSAAESAAEDAYTGPYELPDGISAAVQSHQAAVDAFVQSVIEDYGVNVWPSVDWDNNKIVLKASPASLTSLQSLTQNLVSGMNVEVSLAVVTRQVYEMAIQAINSATFALKPSVVSFSLPADASAIQVNVADLGLLGATVKNVLKLALETITGLPVQLADSLLGDFHSRGDGASPWKGGGQIRHVATTGSAICSDGFAVLKGTSGRLLSAAHCDHTTSGALWSWKDWANNSWIAYSSNIIGKTNKNTLDSLLMDPQGGTEGRVHGGPWNATSASTTRYLLQVSGAGAAYIGMPTCTSGANTGEHCSQKVFIDDDVACAELGVCHRWIAVHDNAGGVSSADGDSGGPVYFNQGNDKVAARGIISKGTQVVVTCGSSRVGSQTTCTNGTMFVGINDTLKQWDVNIETIP